MLRVAAVADLVADAAAALVQREQVAQHQPLPPLPLPRRVGDQVLPRRLDPAVAGGKHRQRLRERLPVARPPELVGVGVDDPVGAVGLGGEAGHAGDPASLVVVLLRLVDQLQDAGVPVALQDLDGAVGGAVVGGHDVVDAGGEVVVEHGGDDVGLVAHQQGEDEPHRRPSWSSFSASWAAWVASSAQAVIGLGWVQVR